MSDKTISTAQRLTPTQKLAASRQTLCDALHTSGKQKSPAPKTQQVVRKKADFVQPALQVKKTRSHARRSMAHNMLSADGIARNAQSARSKNLQQLRTVLGAVLLRRWSKQPARTVAAAMQPVLEGAIRKHPKPALGLAAVGGALLVAWQVWGDKKIVHKKKRVAR